MLCALLVATPPVFAGEWLWTDPADGAQRNARGPGIHVDAFGRSYRDSPSDAWLFEPVMPNGYGLGVDSDGLGRPVRPELTEPGEVLP